MYVSYIPNMPEMPKVATSYKEVKITIESNKSMLNWWMIFAPAKPEELEAIGAAERKRILTKTITFTFFGGVNTMGVDAVLATVSDKDGDPYCIKTMLEYLHLGKEFDRDILSPDILHTRSKMRTETDDIKDPEKGREQRGKIDVFWDILLGELGMTSEADES